VDFDAPNIIAALVFSALGFVYFSYGKKQTKMPLVITGGLLMGYSYFTPTLAWNIGVGLLLALLPLIWRS